MEQRVIKTLVTIKETLLRTRRLLINITLLSRKMKSRQNGLVLLCDCSSIYSHTRTRRSLQMYAKAAQAQIKVLRIRQSMRARVKTQSILMVVLSSSDLTKLHISRPLVQCRHLQIIHLGTIIILTEKTLNTQEMIHLHRQQP